ncbi:hypothetical protein OU415_02510 [Saccharopolyspora sp. WRP15-2]|uniref:Helix-turn-helix DNA binding domain protein n=1 Tax=Saccharopolyspora oryzae TaxID=2997343 RepID=A0ABT4URE6_9PSEU|nr:hypothetical protein [Saccharopolyspora oryzae]MDA3624290.1 hypothetical protein [Saccharopolyspora oryzae]
MNSPQPYRGAPCVFCEHGHRTREACTAAGCTCPGSRNWHDWVVVDLAVQGRGDRIGRPLTPVEKRDVARRLVARGATWEQLATAVRLSGTALIKLLEEVNVNEERAHAAGF